MLENHRIDDLPADQATPSDEFVSALFILQIQKVI